MNRTLAVLVGTIPLLALSALRAQDHAATSAWLTSFADAKAAAKKDKKPILADFTGSDWCVWCQRLKREVFDTPEFADWARKKVVLLELDYPKRNAQDPELAKQNEELRTRFGIESYPTLVFLDAEGSEVSRMGYVSGGPAAFLPAADEKLAKVAAPGAKEEAKPKPEASAWLTSHAEAIAAAKKGKKLILADFTGSDWCIWCQRLDKEVFDTKEFKAWAAKNVVLLKLDYPHDKSGQPQELQDQNARLLEQYKVTGYPTILILNAAGKDLGKLGYEAGGPAKWIPTAEKKLEKARTK